MAYGTGANIQLYDAFSGAPATASAASAAAPAAAGAGGAAAGAGLGGAAMMGGSSALVGILQMMYQKEQERKKAVQDAMQTQMAVAGDNGKNQQNMLAEMVNGYRSALLGGR